MALNDLLNKIKQIHFRQKSESNLEQEPKMDDNSIGPDGLELPPKELVFLVTGQYDPYAFYDNSCIGMSSIREIVEKNGISLKEFRSILDFGCGCGRIIRHWKDFDNKNIIGFDYNPVFLDFCRKAYPFAKFEINLFDKPLSCSDETFDFIYAISVFTHLPEELQFFWIKELRRVLKPGGYLYMTTHGKSRINATHLTDHDRENFLNGQVIICNEHMKGTNLCGTYHPESYVREILAKEFTVVDFVPDGAKDANQDAYLLKK
jgi:SAM-dependent methyltransferase